MWRWVILLVVAGWAVAAGIHATTYFLLADDHALVAQAADGSLANIFTTGLFGVYRPLGFVITKLAGAFIQSSAGWSALVLTLHSANAALVGLVASRLGYPAMAAATAAALFIWSPWGSVAYLWYSGIFDVGAACGILLASVALSSRRVGRTGGIGAVLLAVAGCLVAAGFKENGYLAAAIVPAIVLSGVGRQRYGQVALAAGLAAACGAGLFWYRASLLDAGSTPYSASEFGGRLLSRDVLPAAASNVRALLFWPVPPVWADVGRLLSVVIIWPVAAAVTCSMAVVALSERRAWALVVALGLSLAPTAFYAIDVATITPRRYLYLAGVPLCLLVGRAVAGRLNVEGTTRLRALTATVASLLLAAVLAGASQIGLWRQVAATARCAMHDFEKQVLDRGGSPVYVENMPFAVDHGPFLLLEYDFNYAYRQRMGGTDVAFRRTTLTVNPHGRLVVLGHGESPHDAGLRTPVSLNLCVQ